MKTKKYVKNEERKWRKMKIDRSNNNNGSVAKMKINIIKASKSK
jgi:hypothetical protein